MTDADREEVEITLVISRAAFERAQTMLAEKDPRLSVLGEFAGTMDIEQFLGHWLELHLET